MSTKVAGNFVAQPSVISRFLVIQSSDPNTLRVSFFLSFVFFDSSRLRWKSTKQPSFFLIDYFIWLPSPLWLRYCIRQNLPSVSAMLREMSQREETSTETVVRNFTAWVNRAFRTIDTILKRSLVHWEEMSSYNKYGLNQMHFVNRMPWERHSLTNNTKKSVSIKVFYLIEYSI